MEWIKLHETVRISAIKHKKKNSSLNTTEMTVISRIGDKTFTGPVKTQQG